MSWFSTNQVTKIILVIFIFIVGFWIALPFSGLAAGNITLKVSPGLGGEYKPMGWVPLVVEVSNHGENVEGDLLVEYQGHYNYWGTYYQPVSVATGAAKKVTLLVPGEGLQPSMEVKFVSKGKELSKAKIGGHNIGHDALLVGVLANDLDTANFLATLPKNIFPMLTRVTPLQVEDIPALGAGLQSLSMLIINNFPVEELSSKQVEAIKEWTQSGGLLVLAGGADYDKWSRTSLAELAPVVIKGTTQITSLAELSKMAGMSEAPPMIERPLTISKASSSTGKVLVQAGGVQESVAHSMLAQKEQIPLLVVDQLGRGKVLYVAYDLAEKPLTEWSGNSSLWAQILLQVQSGTQIIEQKMLLEELWPLSNAADRIPALKLPRLSILASIFGLYILVVGPVLFFIFKRVGRREWLWFIVPALACLCALGVYLYGSFERTGNVLAHNVSYVELHNGAEAQIRGASAIFVPKGGEYNLRLSEGGVILPNNQGYASDSQQVKDTWVSLNEEQAQVHFKNVEFWSMRKAFIYKNEQLGEFTSHLQYTQGKLAGTVTNHTELTLYDVRIYHGRHVQEVESLAPGESIQVELSFDTAVQASGGVGGQHLLPQAYLGDEEYYREQILLELLNDHYYSRYQPRRAFSSTSPVTLVGWTQEPIYTLDIPGQEKKDYNLALVKASLNVKPADNGYVFYPAGTFEAVMTESSVQVEHHRDGYMLPSGEITFEFYINRELVESEKELEIDVIHLYTWSDDGTRFSKEVYNWQLGDYETYEQVFEKNKLTKEKIETYLSPEGTLRLKMEHQQDDWRHLGQPAISVEGKVLE